MTARVGERESVSWPIVVRVGSCDGRTFAFGCRPPPELGVGDGVKPVGTVMTVLPPMIEDGSTMKTTPLAVMAVCGWVGEVMGISWSPIMMEEGLAMMRTEDMVVVVPWSGIWCSGDVLPKMREPAPLAAGAGTGPLLGGGEDEEPEPPWLDEPEPGETEDPGFKEPESDEPDPPDEPELPEVLVPELEEPEPPEEPDDPEPKESEPPEELLPLPEPPLPEPSLPPNAGFPESEPDRDSPFDPPSLLLAPPEGSLPGPDFGDDGCTGLPP